MKHQHENGLDLRRIFGHFLDSRLLGLLLDQDPAFRIQQALQALRQVVGLCVGLDFLVSLLVPARLGSDTAWQQCSNLYVSDRLKEISESTPHSATFFKAPRVPVESF